MQEDLSAQLRTLKKRLKEAEDEQYRVWDLILLNHFDERPFFFSYLECYYIGLGRGRCSSIKSRIELNSATIND